MTLTCVQIFREMKYGMDNDETSAFRLPALYCNTDGWKFLENNADDPFYPGKKLSDKKGKISMMLGQKFSDIQCRCPW